MASSRDCCGNYSAAVLQGKATLSCNARAHTLPHTHKSKHSTNSQPTAHESSRGLRAAFCAAAFGTVGVASVWNGNTRSHISRKSTDRTERRNRSKTPYDTYNKPQALAVQRRRRDTSAEDAHANSWRDCRRAAHAACLPGAAHAHG